MSCSLFRNVWHFLSDNCVTFILHIIQVVDDIKTSSIFMCHLNNTIGHPMKIFEVDGYSIPHFVDSQSEQKIDVLFHQGIKLDCTVLSNPKPKVKWTFVNVYRWWLLQWQWNVQELITDFFPTERLQIDEEIITSENKEFYLTGNNEIMRIIESKKSNQGKYLCGEWLRKNWESFLG